MVEAFRGGAGYLAEGGHCARTLSSAVVGADVGHTCPDGRRQGRTSLPRVT